MAGRVVQRLDGKRGAHQPAAREDQSAAQAPTSLRSSVALDVANVRVGTLTIGTATPQRDVQAALSIGADGRRQHRIDHLRLAWERVQAERRLVAQTDAPLTLDVALSAHDALQAALPAASAPSSPAAARLAHWAASATLRGPPAGFDFVADLQGEPRAAPQASASAHVTPFAALPVSAPCWPVPWS